MHVLMPLNSRRNDILVSFHGNKIMRFRKKFYFVLNILVRIDHGGKTYIPRRGNNLFVTLLKYSVK